MEQKINEYRRMSSYEIEEWVPNITNSVEKVAAIIALAQNGDVMKAIEVATRNDLRKQSFALYGSNTRFGEEARKIVSQWDNY